MYVMYVYLYIYIYISNIYVYVYVYVYVYIYIYIYICVYVVAGAKPGRARHPATERELDRKQETFSPTKSWNNWNSCIYYFVLFG